MSARSFTLDKKSQGNIKVIKTEEGRIAILLHGHQVAFKNEDGEIILSSCGYHTPTTKTAINRFLELVGRSERVIQVKGEWYLDQGGVKASFFDGIKIGTKLDRVLE